MIFVRLAFMGEGAQEHVWDEEKESSGKYVCYVVR